MNESIYKECFRFLISEVKCCIDHRSDKLTMNYTPQLLDGVIFIYVFGE